MHDLFGYFLPGLVFSLALVVWLVEVPGGSWDSSSFAGSMVLATEKLLSPVHDLLAAAPWILYPVLLAMVYIAGHVSVALGELGVRSWRYLLGIVGWICHAGPVARLLARMKRACPRNLRCLCVRAALRLRSPEKRLCARLVPEAKARLVKILSVQRKVVLGPDDRELSRLCDAYVMEHGGDHFMGNREMLLYRMDFYKGLIVPSALLGFAFASAGLSIGAAAFLGLAGVSYWRHGHLALVRRVELLSCFLIVLDGHGVGRAD